MIGVGGYASGPVVLMARLGGVPTAICEQNSIPGLTNKILGRVVRRVFLSFEESRRFFKAKKVAMEDFEEALKDTRASVTPEMEKEYEQIAGQIKQNALRLDPIGFIVPGQLKPGGVPGGFTTKSPGPPSPGATHPPGS